MNLDQLLKMWRILKDPMVSTEEMMERLAVEFEKAMVQMSIAEGRFEEITKLLNSKSVSVELPTQTITIQLDRPEN